MARYKQITIKSSKNNAGTQGSRSQIYKGTSTVDPDRASFSMYDIELIKQDLLNHFNIKKGEKIYRPDFGSIIWSLLYEPLTDSVKEAIANDIKEIIDGDPRITANNIIVTQKDYGIQVILEIEYLNYSQQETMLLNFDRENGLVV